MGEAPVENCELGVAPAQSIDSIGGMPEGLISTRREAAIIQLLDDESPVVQAALREEFLRLNDRGISLLRRLCKSRNRITASYARGYLEEIQGPDTVTRFLQFIRSLNYELETGCLLLERTVFPDVDSAECCMTLDAIAARCRELMVLPSSPWEKCRVLNRVIFHEWGFRGNLEEFDDPLNSFLYQIIKRRKGIPISLSILYLLVAQRCDLDLEPIGVPYHFMVGCFLENRPFYIDAFERGRFRTSEDLKEQLRARQIRPRRRDLAPSPVGEVLERCCRNLMHQYSRAGDRERARLFRDFVHEFELSYKRHANP